MIINYKDKKLIFTHIQKCGGTSVINFFKHRKNHNKIKFDIKHLKKINEDIDDYFKFTIIRNPWDRMVSFYHYHKEKILDNKFPTKTWKYIKNLNFSEFLKSNKFQSWALRNNITDYITYNKKTYIDYYINFENLEKDFEIIKKISGKCGKLNKVNKSNHLNYKKYYDEKNKEIISYLFNEEINFFNFKFNKKINLKSLNKKYMIKLS
jgi:hypothetical protein